jgi:hypothetical protein
MPHSLVDERVVPAVSTYGRSPAEQDECRLKNDIVAWEHTVYYYSNYKAYFVYLF